MKLLLKEDLKIQELLFKAVGMYSQLSLTRSRGDPLNHFEISVRLHTRSAELRKLHIKIQTYFIKDV